MGALITLRAALPSESETIARGFLTAMWMNEEEQRKMLPLCKGIAERDDTLYSWRNTVFAEVDGEIAGVLIAYNGATYAEAARTTFTIVRNGGGEDFTQMNHEAEAGEWYIDTLAVFPKFRRQGVATALLRHAIALGKDRADINAITLYVDADHPWVVELYRSLGFDFAGTNVIFNQLYTKMAIEK